MGRSEEEVHDTCPVHTNPGNTCICYLDLTEIIFINKFDIENYFLLLTNIGTSNIPSL